MSSLEEYKTLIDKFVSASTSPLAEKLRQNTFSEEEKINHALLALTPEQKAIVADLLDNARINGIHATLAILSEMQNLQAMKITINEQELPIEPFGTELHFDYIARKAGDDWPA